MRLFKALALFVVLLGVGVGMTGVLILAGRIDQMNQIPGEVVKHACCSADTCEREGHHR